MASLLSQTGLVASNRPRRILLYGVPGIGKSTWAAQAPSHIFLRTEDGDVKCTGTPLLKSLADVMQVLHELAVEDHPYRVAVIDSLSPIDPMCQRAVCEEGGKASIEDFGYGKGYVAAAEKWQEIVAALDRLVQRGMTVVLIGHAAIERVNNPEGDDFDRYTLRLDKRVAPLLIEWCSEVLFANYDITTRKEDAGFNRKKAKAVDLDRVLRTAEKPYCRAKNRLGLPEEIPFDWNVFVEYLKKSKEQT